MSEVKHDAVVVKVYDDCMRVVINKGSTQGVKPGYRFVVFGLGEELFDPITGNSLGIPEDIRGRGVATHVQEDMTTLTSIEKKKSRITRKVKPSPWMGGFNALKTAGDEVTEEEEILVPFTDPCVDDYVRDITGSAQKRLIELNAATMT